MGPKSTRAQATFLRTYCRSINSSNTMFETFTNVIDRVINHQKYLWERQLGRSLNIDELNELDELEQINLNMKALPGGRILWTSGTELVKEREISSFNCTNLRVNSISDVVDLFWCLLNGAGTGATIAPGALSGFANPIENIEVVRSKRTDKGGVEHNVETFDYKTKVWTIKIGDSGEAWAKSIGKLLASKFPATKLVLDFSEIRPKGTRLSRYGWISSGDDVISEEYLKIAQLLSRRADELLRYEDIHDIINHLGVVQTGRRGAQIIQKNATDIDIDQFINFKKDIYSDKTKKHRQQSNNSILYWEQPTRLEMEKFFDVVVKNGGSEPGIINGQSTKRDCPWFEGFNPCVEVALPDGGVCNLYDINLSAATSLRELTRTAYLVGRANYRQTLVNLRDGILQNKWHENNEFLRLCGVSLCGAFVNPHIKHYELAQIRTFARSGAIGMADELGTSRPKAVTVTKPSGTLSKVFDTSAGINPEMGEYIFNKIIFNENEPLVKVFKDANYEVIPHPSQKTMVLITFPVHNADGNWTQLRDGRNISNETAIEQLERYRMYMTSWADMNCSNTIMYSPEEIPEIIDWLSKHWDTYKGVAFMLRPDNSITAKEMGYDYLPQEVVTKKTYDDYFKTLKHIDLTNVNMGAIQNIDEVAEECSSGMCPIR